MAIRTVMICDDSDSIHSSLVGYLQDDDIKVISVFSGEAAVDVARGTSIDVVLLDIMLPGIDGYEVCRRLRQSGNPYIIMLSARGEENDRILGLEIGADDYIAKPFSPREVSIKIRKALDRLNPKAEVKKLTLAELTVYPDSGQVLVGDNEVARSAKEISVLDYMMNNVGKILSREHILNAVWGYDYFGDTRIVDAVIKNLRKKLITDGVHFSIFTVYGSGYRLEERR